jgi:hypothetical protein
MIEIDLAVSWVYRNQSTRTILFDEEMISGWAE